MHPRSMRAVLRAKKERKRGRARRENERINVPDESRVHVVQRVQIRHAKIPAEHHRHLIVRGCRDSIFGVYPRGEGPETEGFVRPGRLFERV